MRRVAVSLLALSALSACGLLPTEPLDPDEPGALPTHPIRTTGIVEFSAQVQWVDNALRVLLFATNSGVGDARVETGQCNIRLRAFRTVALSEPAVWDDHMRENMSCVDVLYEYDILPGDTAVIERNATEGVADSWPPPRDAYFGVVIIENGQRRLLEGGRVTR